jgi:hypothetical protein
VAGCDTHPVSPGNHGASRDRVLGWMGAGAVLGALDILSHLAGALGSLTGPAAGVALGAIIMGAAGGAVLGFFVGFTVEWFFNRLKVQNPETITINGELQCTGKNTGVPPINDNDWTFNMFAPFTVTDPVLPGLTTDEVRTRAAPGSGLSQAYATYDPTKPDEPQVFHCEISSRMGDYAAVGGTIGSVAGAALGIAGGAAACAALAAVTFGFGLAVCALLLAAAFFAGALVGGILGDLIGTLIGFIADKLRDFDELGESVRAGCIVNFTGRWVTDVGHQHNEVHDIKSVQTVECPPYIPGGQRPEGQLRQFLTGAVGIGRHPTGPDP